MKNLLLLKMNKIVKISNSNLIIKQNFINILYNISNYLMWCKITKIEINW